MNNINNIRATFLISAFCLYPFLSFITLKFFNMEWSFAFTAICYLFLGHLLVKKYLQRESIVIPNYLLFYVVFLVYTILTGIFVSGHHLESSLFKYLYSNHFFAAFIVLLLIENTKFSPKLLKKAAYVLFIVIIIGAVVSIIQIKDPLFFYILPLNIDIDMPTERLLAYIPTIKENRGDLGIIMLLDNRHPSIYSWTHPLSVGFDFIAVFSILWGLKIWNQKSRLLLLLSGVFVAFLTGTRWIMLNFFIVSFQTILTSRNKILTGLKYAIFSIVITAIVIYGVSLFGFDIERFIKNRLLSSSANTRLYAFEIFSEVFPKRPLWGTGGADTKDMLSMLKGITSQIHVGWLKLFYYYGIIGGTIFISFLGMILLQLRARAIASGYWGSFFAFFAFVVANCTLVEFSIFYHGLLLAIIYSKPVESDSEAERDEIPVENATPFQTVSMEKKNKPLLVSAKSNSGIAS